MGFKKGNQNIDSVFYGTDYVERMYLGGEQFFQASYLDFYKTNFFSIGLGQEKRQIDNPMGDGAISYIKTEWSSQYGYQLEVKQASTGRHTNYTDTVFKENFSFMLPKGNYLLKVTIKNIPSSESKGTLGCDLFKKEDNTSLLKNNPVFYNGTAGGFSVLEDTEVYLGIYINDLNPEKTSIFSLELSPAEKENEKFTEKTSFMVRGRKKEIYNSSVSSIDITIPAKAFYSGKEYPVEYIDSDAFNYEVTENGETVSQLLTKISKITVEGNNMIGFGNRAFQNCSNCMRFSCTSSVFQGGLFANNAAFEGCEALNSLTLSIVKNINGLKTDKQFAISMGGRNNYSFDDSFAGTSVTGIRWKNWNSSSKTEEVFQASFGPGSFEGCTQLTTIVSNDANSILGEDIFNVGSAAFAGCTSLDTKGTGFGANTGPLYSSIGSQAFSGCTGLTSVDFGTKEGAETIIGSQAFENCTGITSINLPSTVTSIGSQAFSGCSSLETINIPFIGESATSTNNKFSYIFGTVPTSLTTVGFSEGNNIIKIPDYAFDGCSGLTSITLPNSVTSIGDGALRGCSGLTNINIPDGVTSIGYYVFQGCSGLTSINIPDGVTSISYYAFGGCSGLTNINIPNSVTSIGSYAFQGCSGLTNINIPNSVTSIGSYAFNECSNLETINIPFIGESATSTNNKFSYIFGTVPTSLTTVGFSEGNNITEIPDYAFQGCSNITSINGNDTGNIVSIGAYGYAGTGITSIKISSTLASIGSQAFSGCTGLTSVRFKKIDDNKYVYRVIGLSAFEGCSNLTGVEVPGGFSATEDDHGIPWLSLEASESWELNDFANETANPLYYAKNLKTQNVVNNPSSSSEDYVKANYFKNFPSSSIKSFCYIGLTGIQLKINSVAQIGTKAFLGSSFEELHLSFRGIQDETGALISKAQILSNAFQDVSITKNLVDSERKVDLDTNIPILFYEDAFKNFNISTTKKYFEFIPREMDWGSLCYFANEGANPIGQNGATLAEPVFSGEKVDKVTTAYIDTSEQNWAISHLGIDPSKWGYQYCNNLNITSLSIRGNKNETWQVPCGFCSGCSNLGNFPTKQFLEWCDKVNDYGFYNCSKLSFAISKSRLFVGDGGFYNTGVTDISLAQPTGRDVAIGERAFANCSRLKSLNISNPYSVDERKPAIGENAFANCENLSSVIISQSSSTYEVTIGAGIFENCNNLESIEIPSFSSNAIPGKQRWKGSIFYLFNSYPSSYSILPDQGAYSCVSGERYTLFLPNSLKTFICTDERSYNVTYPVIGYTLYNNADGSTPALLFQEGQGKTTVYNSASSYSEEAFKNNNGSITVR